MVGRIAPRATALAVGLGHRCWALYGLGRTEEALGFVRAYLRLDPTGRYPLMTHAVLLQALGRTEEAQDAMRKLRKVAPAEPSEFWVGLARGSYMPEMMFKSYSQHFIDVWNTTPVE